MDLKLEGVSWSTGDDGPYSASQTLKTKKNKKKIDKARNWFSLILILNLYTLLHSLSFSVFKICSTNQSRNLSCTKLQKTKPVRFCCFLSWGATCVGQWKIYTSADHNFSWRLLVFFHFITFLWGIWPMGCSHLDHKEINGIFFWLIWIWSKIQLLNFFETPKVNIKLIPDVNNL